MEEFRKQLAEIINTSELPFEAKFYVLKDLFREVNDIYINLLQQKEKEKEAEVEEEKEA